MLNGIVWLKSYHDITSFEKNCVPSPFTTVYAILVVLVIKDHQMVKPIEINNMYLLTEWEGRMGKYLALGQGIRTERRKVRTSWPRAKYFPVRPDLTQSISILSYDHVLLKNLKIPFEPK